jgi:ATP-binding cassette, subfamily B, bacterial PglK
MSGCAKVHHGGPEATLVPKTRGDYEAPFAIKKSIALLDTFRKLRSLLNPREQRQALLLLGLMLVVGLVEMVGIASIFPLIAVLSDPTLIDTNPWLNWAYHTFGFSTANSFYVFLATVVFVIIVGRTSLTAISSYAVLRFTSMRSHSLATRLLEVYLDRDYSWFLNNHTAETGKTILSEVHEVVTGSLLPAMQFVSQAIISACIIIIVVLVDPITAILAIAVLASSYIGIYTSIRHLLTGVGRRRLSINKERFKVAQEALGGIKDVKVGRLEQGYLRRFRAASREFEGYRSTLQVLSDVPRYALEVVSIGGMLVVIIVLLFRSEDGLVGTLPIIAIYAFAAMRLLPTLQMLYRSAVLMRASAPALDKLQGEFAAYIPRDKNNAPPLNLRKQIELRSVDFAYPGARRQAIRGLSMIIPVHTTIALVGKTGAGKSTIVDLILGLLRPQSGQLLVDGTPIDETNVRAWQAAIGYVPQDIFLADESIAANIAFGVAPDQIDMMAVRSAAKLALLDEFIATELPDSYETKIGERGVRLSGGQRQRLGIARALYHDPQVLILDEATSALDNDTERQLMESVRNLAAQKTIIMIAHRLTTVRPANVIYMVHNGGIERSGSYNQLYGSTAAATET